MTKLQKIGFSSLALASTISTSFAGMFDKATINSGIKGDDNSADNTIQTLVSRALGFLGLVAVLYGIWGGFQILTAAGDEAKVKKGRTVLIHALLGLLVIFLAYSIVNWLLGSIFGSTK